MWPVPSFPLAERLQVLLKVLGLLAALRPVWPPAALRGPLQHLHTPLFCVGVFHPMNGAR
jgi:hypothetical protein